MPDGSWALTTGGTWSTAANWTSSVIADGAGFTATFSKNITANRTITLDTSRSIGGLSFTDATTGDFYWTLTSSAGVSLTLDNGLNKPTIYSGNGNLFNSTNRHIVTALLAGSNGFEATGNIIVIRNTSNTISGTVDISGEDLALGDIVANVGTYAASANVLPNITDYNLTSTSSGLHINTDEDFTFPSTISGSGNVYVRTASGGTNKITFPSGTFTSYSNASATYGLAPYASGGVLLSYLSLSELPEKITYIFDGSGSTGTNIGVIDYDSSSDATFATCFNLNLIDPGTIIGCTARFYNVGTGKITITGETGSGVAVRRLSVLSGVNPGFSLQGSNTLDNEISGIIGRGPSGPGDNAFGLAKNDVGRWIVSGVNTYAGNTNILQGYLGVASDAGLGSASGPLSLATGAYLEFSRNITVNKASSTWTLSTGSTLVNVSGDNTITASVMTIGGTQAINVDSGSLAITNAISGGTSRIINKDGTGNLKFTNPSTGYLGTINVNAGTLSAFKMANVAATSSLGTQALAQATLSMGSDTTLSHIGTSADSTDRIVTCSAASGSHFTFDSSGSGSGAITYTTGGTFTFSTSGTHNLIFSGTNTATNTFERTIDDASGGGAVSIVKNGSNTWNITSSITATGSFTCNAGTLAFGNVNRVFSNSIIVNGGTVSIDNSYTIAAPISMNGGKITAVLAATATLTVNSSSTELSPAALEPDDSTNGNNLITTSPTINGCLDLITPSTLDISVAGRGRVLGTSNTVTVSSTGIIRTKFSVNQAGKARYNNLTLQAGSKLKIGFAA